MKKSLIVVIVILSIVILGLSTFIVYDKDLLGIKRESKKESNDVVEKSDDTNTTNEIDINSNLVVSLTKLIENYSMRPGYILIPYSDSKEVILNNELDDGTKGRIAFYNTKLDNSYYDDSIVSEEVRNVLGRGISIENISGISSEGVKLIKDKFEEMFGYDGFKEATGCPNIKKYNDNYYVLKGCGYGGGIDMDIISPVSASMDNSDIIINAKVVFVFWVDQAIDNTYSGIILSTDMYDVKTQSVKNQLDSSTYTNIENLDSSNFDVLYSPLEKYAKDNADLLDTYVYRFKKHNNSYYLYSVKKSD